MKNMTGSSKYVLYTNEAYACKLDGFPLSFYTKNITNELLFYRKLLNILETLKHDDNVVACKRL